MRSKLFITIFLVVNSFLTLAQGIKGTIRNEKGEILSNASLFIPEIKAASSSNNNGEFSIKLPAGNYTLLVRYIGYKSVEFAFQIKDGWISQDFSLVVQDIKLKEVAVRKAREEDFANTIMRKTIAKKRLNQLLYNSFEMMAYIKGTGQLTDAPFFIKKKLEKEGLRMDEAYATESVSEFKFSQPNTITERVISVRTKGENPAGVGPSSFLNESFYDEKISGSISPLSHSAFRYYKFTYEGSFTEKDKTVFKIKVSPRSKGDNLFEGSLYILEDFWAIHSLDFTGTVTGFPFRIKQNYAEVANAVFLPVTHQLQISICIFGFKGNFKYLVSCNNYKVELNKNINPKIEVLDEKIDEVLPEVAKEEYSKLNSKDQLREGKTLTRKQLAKVMDDYEKEAQKGEHKIVENKNFSIDKMASKRDSSYWDSVRTVPLTASEQKGYRSIDSASTAKKKSEMDSVNKTTRGFKVGDIVFGNTYRLSKNKSFRLSSALGSTYFNPVEGVNINFRGYYRNKLDALGSILEIMPAVRYGFSSKDFYSKALAVYTKKTTNNSYLWSIEGGHFVEQFNGGLGINELYNTFSSLLAVRNYMKLYEKTYLSPEYSVSPSAALKFTAKVQWEDRHQLSNTTDFTLSRKDRSYSDNTPLNIELANTSFANHQALTASTEVTYRPFLKYRLYNGKKRALVDGSPELRLIYKKGVKDILGSDIDYDFVQIQANHSFSVAAGNKLTLTLQSGKFLNNRTMYFMDFKHFEGNQMAINIALRPSFKLLDYYSYSTNNSFLSGNVQYHLRKFLVTRIPEARLIGMKENVFFSYLKTKSSPNYYEVGYSLDNIFRILRLDLATSFIDSEHKDFGLRIGITSLLRIKKK